jgi:AraC family L-rhamnose operon transcriptional activator RhaR
MDPPDLGQPARALRHWAPSSPRLDPTAEPLIGAASVVGLWPLEHFQAVPWHDHDFYEVAFVLQGSGYHFAGQREQPIRAGSVIFVPPGTAHGYRALKGVAVYNCFFRAELADFELLWAARDRGLVELFGNTTAAFRQRGAHVITQLDDVHFNASINELDAIRNTDPAERSHANEIAHLLLALDIVARRGRAAAGPVAAPPTSQAPRIVSQALELIEGDLARSWSLADLAGEVYVTTYYLAHQFKKWVGIPPAAFICRRRAEHAAFLLTGTDDSIASVGRAVGWPEPAAFSRQFRRAYGVSPRAFRQRGRDSG